MPSVQSPTSPAATPSQAESHPPCTHARAPNADHGRPAHTCSQSAPRQTQAPEEPESKARKPRRVDGGQRNLHTHAHQKRQPGVVPKPPLPTRMLICLAKGFLVFLFGSSDDQIKAGRTYAHPPSPSDQKQTTAEIPTPGTRGTSDQAGSAEANHPETDGERPETASTRARCPRPLGTHLSHPPY